MAKSLEGNSLRTLVEKKENGADAVLRAIKWMVEARRRREIWRRRSIAEVVNWKVDKERIRRDDRSNWGEELKKREGRESRVGLEINVALGRFHGIGRVVE